jgi:glycosyltransferase involved in cell wall biosynthesis
MSPLSIVIITLNEEKRIGRLLTDLSEQTHQDFEVILVDSNSDDETCMIAQEYEEILPNLTIHKMETRGVSLGRNTGAALAQHERILFLDADVRLEVGFLAKSLDRLEKRGLEVSGGYLGTATLPMMYRLGYGATNLGMFVTQYGFPTAVGACIFSTRRAHKHVGGFDEGITLCEDCDYVKRLAKTFRFRLIPVTFQFDPRRLEQDGLFSTGWLYLKANLRRFFFGEIRKQEIAYRFAHYDDQNAA